MKNFFKTLVYFGIIVLVSGLSGCTKLESPETGIKDIKNPKENKEITFYGETITVSFVANAAWEPELVLEGDWAKITSIRGNKASGRGSVRINFQKNITNAKRVARLFVKVAGCNKAQVAEFTQTFDDAAEISDKLVKVMHKRLSEEYLWRDKYNELDAAGKINHNARYVDFLSENLVKLGDVNLEDGGTYRDYSSLKGQRYIYSYIQEITPVATASKSTSTEPVTKAYARADLGIGPTMSSLMNDKGTICLLIGYVYEESPAWKAGLRRGDMIVEVNNIPLTKDNYLDFQRELYYSPQGTYTFKYYRVDKKDGMAMQDYTTRVTTAAYSYNPVLFCGVWTDEKTVNIGYLVLDSFDIEYHEQMQRCLTMLKEQNIKDLILDLRFNPGGSVALCRYMMSSIVGSAHYDDTFCKMTFVDGREEVWTFGYGDKSQPDGLGQGPDLGLKNIYIICSENTGSASELVINGLDGIGFPYVTIGSRTEGKNVGMTVTTHDFSGRRFEYAPITFRNRNAKDKGDFANGFPPMKMVNNQNADYNDDIDQFFPYGTGDWDIAYKADVSVRWAFTLITTGKDLEFSEKQVAKTMSTLRTNRLDNESFSPKMGRFGSLIYKNE